MKNKNVMGIFIACAALLLPMTASAATINLANSNLNGNMVDDYSADGSIDFDIFINNDGIASIIFDLTPAEMAAGSVALRLIGFTDSLPGGLISFLMEVPGSSIVVGDAFDSNGDALGIFAVSSTARLIFAPPETVGFSVGSLGAGNVDWVLNFPTDTASLELRLSIKAGNPVPLPAGVWLLLSALAGLGVVRRRAS